MEKLAVIIKSLVKKEGLKVLSSENNKMKVVNFQNKKKYNIIIDDYCIRSDNYFYSKISTEHYKSFLKSKGFKEIIAKSVIINSDCV